MENRILIKEHRGERVWLIELVSGLRLRLCLQCSGQVLVKGKTGRYQDGDSVWYSCYEDDLYRDHCLNNRMYAKTDRLVAEEIQFIRNCCHALRKQYPDWWA